MYHISLVNSENQFMYEKYVNSKNAEFEYSISWKNIIKKNFGFNPYHLICFKGGKVCGILPLFKAKSIFGTRLVSTPYSIYTGVLSDNDEVKKKLLDYVKNIQRFKNVQNIQKLDYVEIREKNLIESEIKPIIKSFNFFLGLSTSEEVWKKLPKGSVRWGIKKAKISNLTWSQGNSDKELNEFYNLFLQTRKHRGVPGYPYNFFKDIKSSLKTKIYVTKLNNKAVASIFLIYHNKEVRYAFAGAVYDREILKMQPYHLIMWEAIKDACERNYNVFNFGGATASTNMGGLYEFKKKWSDEIIEIPSYFYSNKEVSGVNENNLMFKLASGIWKKLPLPLVKKLSPIAIKQFV